MADFDSVGSSASSTDSELQEFLMIEKQKAQVNAQVWHMMNKNTYLSMVRLYVYDFLVDS